MFDGLSCNRIELDLVKDDQTLTRIQSDVEYRLKSEEKRVQIPEVILEERFDLIGYEGEIDKDAGTIFVLGEFLYDSGLSDTSGTFYHQCIRIAGILLPFQQFLIDFSFEKGAPTHTGIIWV